MRLFYASSLPTQTALHMPFLRIFVYFHTHKLAYSFAWFSVDTVSETHFHAVDAAKNNKARCVRYVDISTFAFVVPLHVANQLLYMMFVVIGTVSQTHFHVVEAAHKAAAQDTAS